MKKTISAFALSVLLLGTMTGCGNKGIAPFVMPENGYDGSEVTITFYHAMGQELQGKLKQHITKFESLYPTAFKIFKASDVCNGEEYGFNESGSKPCPNPPSLF